jgi:predicted GNAT family N-acyltransferase
MMITSKIVSTADELKKVYDLRVEVFVNEQKVPPELELDEWDKTAVHILASNEKETVGCGRIILAPDHAHIGRIAVKKNYRNKGIGKQMMLALIEICIESGAKKIILHSQLQALPFYESLGFVAHGDIFLDAGIEHREMEFLVL